MTYLDLWRSYMLESPYFKIDEKLVISIFKHGEIGGCSKISQQEEL